MLNYKTISKIKNKLKVSVVTGLATLVFGCGDVNKGIIDEDRDKTTKKQYIAEILDDNYSMIMFSSNRGGNYDIYTIGYNGEGLEQITNTTWNEYSHSWSPDGNEIVYQSDKGSNQDTGEYHMNIFKMNSDGTNQIQLTNLKEGGSMPDWSPDGNKIVFVSNKTGVSEVYIMDTNGDNVEQQTFSDNVVSNWQPEFSPDGNKIVYSKMELSNSNMFLYVLNLNNRSNKKIETGAVNNQTPSWSPDGNYIAFASNLSNENSFNIGVINLNTGKIKELTNNGKRYNPSWSPDGKWIIYQAINNVTGKTGIHKINVDTKEEVILVEDVDYNNTAPSWSPYLE